jgi:hemolysin activation/secretion protein
VAVRALGYHAGGERPRRLSIGGSWALRGYPRWGYVTGTTAWLFNAEWRFPITNFLSVGFPFGELRFPGVQGALFSDYGRAWTPVTTRRGALGSSGLGLRMPIGAPLVLRLDLGYRWHSGDDGAYSLPPRARRSRFVDFFFGFNY